MALTIDPRATALVLIDLQNGILGMPLAPHDAGTVLANALALGHAIKQAGGIVVGVRVGFAADRNDQLRQLIDAPTAFRPDGLPSDWSELAQGVAALAPEVVIVKRQWSAFHGTELDLQLRRRGITTIILGGIATNFGVESTAREAHQHNYAVILAEDATSSIGDDMHRFSVEKIMPRLARVRATAEIVAELAG